MLGEPDGTTMMLWKSSFFEDGLGLPLPWGWLSRSGTAKAAVAVFACFGCSTTASGASSPTQNREIRSFTEIFGGVIFLLHRDCFLSRPGWSRGFLGSIFSLLAIGNCESSESDTIRGRGVWTGRGSAMANCGKNDEGRALATGGVELNSDESAVYSVDDSEATPDVKLETGPSGRGAGRPSSAVLPVTGLSCSVSLNVLRLSTGYSLGVPAGIVALRRP